MLAVLVPGALLGACDPLDCPDNRICAVIGTGELGFNSDGLDALETKLASPTSVRLDPDGRVVVVDYSNMRVRVLQDDGTVTTLVGNGLHAYSEVGEEALETPLENPVDARWGAGGLLHVLPQHEGRLIRLDDGGRVERVAGTGELHDSGDGGPALDAEMGYGGGFALAADGSLYISDSTHSRVRRVDPEGVISTVLGLGQVGFDRDGHGPEVGLSSPERLVVDEARGRLLVVDTNNSRVGALDLETLDFQTLAGTGEAGYSGDGGPAREARLSRPVGVEVLAGGTVLVSDLENNVLRAISPDGIIETVAGTGAYEDPLELRSSPLEMSIRRPAGLELSPEGDLLIAERAGHRVLRWVGAEAALEP